MNIAKLQLEQGERVLLQVRKHWFLIASKFFLIALVAILPYFAYGALQSSESIADLIQNNVNTALVVALYSAWILVSWMALFNIWNNYYLDVWTITNKRLIAVDQKGFFSRTTASFRLDRLQDIEISVHGILATFLDFGSLEVQTAGEERNFSASGLPSPGVLKTIILKATNDTPSKSAQNNTDGL